ncbi:MAG: hypothetical protein B7Z15_06755 [Rhizobiales bacterium 32-66-8]|nr:MAG: hypothetical protein B7Z15_06755 [Rhizobiales bacterium 32-66-8]
MKGLVNRALISGSVASVLSSAALALLAKRAGKSAVQPTNATSHWMHGDKAGAVRQADAPHTLVGFLTHHASAVFWAFLFERLRGKRPAQSPARLARDAATTVLVASVVDYALVPKRLTPGWEQVVSKKSISTTYAVMALGLVIGGLMVAERRRAR